MLSKKIIFLSSVAALLSIGAYQLGSTYLDRLEMEEYSREKEEDEAREHAASRDYRLRRMMNPATGVVSAADVMNARRLTMQAMNNNQRDGELQWEFLGPNNVGGRTRTLIVDRNNSNHLIAASVSGGVFVSNDAGGTWSDHPQNYTSVGANTVFESAAFSCGVQAPNGDIYLGTGEGFYYVGGSNSNGNLGEGSAGVPGEGIYKSSDNGVTFQLLPATRPSGANDAELAWVAVNKIAAAPNGYIYAAHNRGLERSTDGGASWQAVSGAPANTEAVDVMVASNGVIHAMIGSVYYRSTDNGETFVNLGGATSGKLPNTATGRRRLAVSPTDPNKLYAVLVRTNSCLLAVYSTTDGGDTWNIIGEGDPDFFEPMANGAQCQGDYDLAFAVDPANDNRIFLAGVTLWTWSSTDGWAQIDNLFEEFSNLQYVHADKHDIVFDPNDPQKLYVVSDGGIGFSSNASADLPQFTVKNRNYNITQFYSVAASLQGRVAGGTQDNGSRYIAFNGTNSFLNSSEVRGGDGGYADISLINPNVLFMGNPGGELIRSANEGGGFVSVLDQNIDCQPLVNGACNPDGIIDGGAEFVTPFILWEDLALYQSSGNVEVKARFATGANNGKVWYTNNPLDVGTVATWQNPTSVSGGVSCVNFSKDGNYLWAGSQTGRIRRVSNLDAPNPTAASTITIAAGRYVTGVNPGNTPNELIVTLGNYGEADNIYYTTNALNATPTFESIQANLPPMPVYDAIQLSADNNLILAATEMGVWMYDKAAQTWTPQNTNIGNVPVFRIREITMSQEGCPVVYIGTHGRGLYRCTLYANPLFCNTSLPVFTATPDVLAPAAALNITTFPNPISEIGTIQVALPQTTTAVAQLYNTSGVLVRSIDLGKRNAGTHNIPFNVSQLPAGMYLLNLSTPQGSKTHKIVVR